MDGVGIFFLLLLIAFLLYFFGGMLLMYWRGATGLELIPNFTFWKELPFNIKKGVMYCVHGCRNEDSYERI